jgi:hypothetical protein
MTRRPLCLTLLAGLATTAAHAAPPALDHVPQGAVMVAAVDNVGELGARLQALIERLGMDDAAQQVSMATMTIGGFGVKPEGSAAIVVMDGDLEALESGQGPIALIAEFTDYNAFISNFGGDPEADVAEFSMQGSPAFARDLGGGWVALGPDRATIEGIEAGGGDADALGRWAGAIGRDIADESNLVVMFDFQAMKPMLEEGMQGIEDGLAEAEAMGGAQGAMGADIARGFVDSFMRDARVGVIGMHIDDSGVAIDMAAQFQDGSDLAGYFQDEGNASGLMGRLPKVPVLFAAAFDSSHAGVQKVIAQLGELRERMLPDAPPNQLMEMLSSADGGAVVIGNSPALLSGGIFSNSALYLATDQPARVMEANEDALAASDGLEQPGMTMQTAYNHNALTVAGAEVDSWSISMELDPDSPMAQQMSMGLMGLFGPTGGPSGYMAEIDGGVVGTLSQNRRLLETAINAARAGNGLSEGEEIGQAAANLRDGNIAELYIGVGNILSTVTSVMGMMGMDMDVDIPQDIGAVPLAIGSMDGGVRIRTFLPTDVIVTVSELSAYFQQMQGGMNPMGADEWEENEDDSGF